MRWVKLAALLAAMGAAVVMFGRAVLAASAAIPCVPLEVLQAGLAQQYGERRFAVALDLRGQPIALYVNPVSGSWSYVILVPAAQIGCLVAGGTQFQSAGPPAASADTSRKPGL